VHHFDKNIVPVLGQKIVRLLVKRNNALWRKSLENSRTLDIWNSIVWILEM